MSSTDLTTDLTSVFDDEVVTKSLVRDVALPGGGTLALVTLDNGHDHTKPNTLGPHGMNGLKEVVDALAERARAGQIAAVAFTGKPFIFAVGADLTGVAKLRGRDDALAIARLGHDVYSAIADLPVPTFAFINGAVMGGGVELTLACDYRTISASVPAVALPECFLGLVPGWGGCFWLPNLIGIKNAVKVVIENPLNTNRMLTGPQAAKLGMADVLLEPADFIVESIRWAAGVLHGSITVQRAPIERDEQHWARVIETARGLVEAKTGGAAPAPLRALELLAGARTAERAAAFAAEDEAIADSLMSPQLRAGLYAFDLVQKRARRPAGAPDKSLARPVTKVGIVGAGLMAGQLALLFLRRLHVPVVMTDLDEERVAKGVQYVTDEIDKLVAKGRVSSDEANRLRALITGDTDKSAFADADFVIEAVFEEMSVKQQVLAQVEAVVSPEAVLATNTSSLSITTMAAQLAHPERVVGFHFFNPVAVMPLLEIVKGGATDDATLATAFATAKALKKTAILVSDSPSFIVNRLLGRFMSQLGAIADAGTPIATIEKAFAGVTPMSPYVLIELVGPAIALHNNETLAAAFPDRFAVPVGLKALVEAGRRGVYRHDADSAHLDEQALALLPSPAQPVELDAEQVRTTTLQALADEARRMLDEGVVAAPMDIDLGMITGSGFAFWNGGLTPLLDREGISERVTGQRFLPPGVADAGK
ncbi:3-hydroxyacyl-CoA dehydrogenase/enoyl-CoA hydratase/carnithine racemase [Kineosphaera limosa]|uniref:Putative fatty acid oxidation complex subunit alpha n=1 Tax=Kineosphaera limosa NBRC 100340 TaxID=1184609 RepID=K6WLR4_9MICO|nr:3-hydroxyacyl-CoA dehydrogenase NAD-binding domain-containing protein [Kineosphaera limosa]NYD98928.1 3-hydroxyacyl-CoA dehydrogenase/enoyl-CoA hydratase/carnithine racemase [Kineosphaera limosa]GAB94746.1 putative fatty acid oxidation complex subunit alpha [Kineosphaera limosa NBRC 100340]